jgi:UDP-N-acetylmuramate--alanine ligase
MSALAQLLQSMGYAVAGSDRDLTGEGWAGLYRKLEGLGIRVFPQDGSGVREIAPRALFVSGAVEDGNPDLVAGAAIPRYHRARAMAELLDRLNLPQIAVAGSCGKTTVTAWITAALRALGEPVLSVCGGYMCDAVSPIHPGNFVADAAPRWTVYEADESDGSLVVFRPDVGVVLNLGRDHFERDQLVSLFRAFLGGCSRGTVTATELPDEVRAEAPPGIRFGTAAPEVPRPDLSVVSVSDYACTADGVRCTLAGIGPVHLRQYGRHSALNAAATAAVLRLLGIRPDRVPEALQAFSGVEQRFQRLGRLESGATLFQDYAHNPQKIGAALETVIALTQGRVFCVFQPHGFRPLAFMREELARILAAGLRSTDTFAMLPVYYAGGTASFSPTSEEVVADLRSRGVPSTVFETRDQVRYWLGREAGPGDSVLVLGARDPSLPVWACSCVDG